MIYRGLSRARHACSTSHGPGVTLTFHRGSKRATAPPPALRRDNASSPRHSPSKASQPARSLLLGWPTVLFGCFNLFLAAHLVTTYAYTIRPTAGPSMLPTIAVDGDWVLISKLYRRGKNIQVGDIVSYIHPMRPEAIGIKRVVGMPGDFVARDTPDAGDGILVQVPAGHCWLVGDNLPWSRDSRMFGPLPLALIRGRVLARVYPHFTRFDSRLVEDAQD